MSERGVVTSVSPLTVALDASDTDLPTERLTSYTPALNDRVIVDTQCRPLVILGKVVP